MRYTTTIWTKPVADNVGLDVAAKCQELEAIGIFSVRTEIDEDTRQVITRSWPDLAAAESWCVFVLGLGATSAVVNPE